MLNNPEYQKREVEVANKVAAAWSLQWGQMGPYSPFDVYLRKDKKIVAIAEIRTRRDRECHSYTTALLDLDKWFSLMQAEIALGLPGLYIVAFTDGIWWVRIGRLPVRDFKLEYRGRVDRPQAYNDLSPVIQVPTSYFKRVCDSDGVFKEESDEKASND